MSSAFFLLTRPILFEWKRKKFRKKNSINFQAFYLFFNRRVERRNKMKIKENARTIEKKM